MEQTLYQTYLRDTTANMPYANHREHLKEWYAFFDALVLTALWARGLIDAPAERLRPRGMVTSPRELEAALDPEAEEEALPEHVVAALKQMAEHIRAREGLTAQNLMPLCHLGNVLGLTLAERFLVLGALACEYDRKYECVFGHLQDDLTKKLPAVGTLVSICTFWQELDPEEEADLLLGRGRAHKYLLSCDSGKPGTLPARPLKLRPAVAGYLLRGRQLWGEEDPYRPFFPGADRLPDVLAHSRHLSQLYSLWAALGEEGECLVHLYGKKGIGKRFLVKQLAERSGFPVLFFSGEHLKGLEKSARREAIVSAMVEAALMEAKLCVYALEGTEEWIPEMVRLIGEDTRVFFLLSKEKCSLQAVPGPRVAWEIPPLAGSEKLAFWKECLKGRPLGEVDVLAIANRHILTPEEIGQAVDTAALYAGAQGVEEIGNREIREAIRQENRKVLGDYARLIPAAFVWEDLVIAPGTREQLLLICNQSKYKSVVRETWGFNKKMPYGNGVSVLFYGSPGTGKTMAAQVLANELGLDLYRIDISQMVSKYIGETEKNISQLFEKAKDINAVLFFDEADALFSKRSEVKDSHDRNANAETAHLLQQFEEYDGIVILATNYLNNIDAAFKRRIKYMVEFALPNKEERYALWAGLLPPEAALEEPLDLRYFAAEYELSGSAIKEILLNAAYMAAAEGGGMRNRHLAKMLRLNYLKSGKMLTQAECRYLV